MTVSSWVQGNQTAFSFISAIVSSGGMAAYNGLKNGVSTGSSVIHVNKSNPNAYDYANGYTSNTGSTVSITVSLSDLEAYAMSLSKAEQAALGITVAATGVMNGGNGSQGPEDSDYKSPDGGGGTTSTIKVNGKTITIGHGGRHLEGTNLTINDVNAAISNDVVNRTLSSGFNEFTIKVNGTDLVYRAFQLGPDKINIGTYFIPK